MWIRYDHFRQSLFHFFSTAVVACTERRKGYFNPNSGAKPFIEHAKQRYYENWYSTHPKYG